jgi:DNA helicase-2/ATP-dependent DNA helicase PcrA
MKFSEYQEAVFDWVVNGRGSCVVEAVAGSGKTTTIVHAAGLIPQSKRAVFLAFNKRVAEELKSRLPAHVEARTLNSLGNGIVFRHAGRLALDPDKLDRVVKETITTVVGANNVQTMKYPLTIAMRRVRNLGLLPKEIDAEVWDQVKAEIVYECDELDKEFLVSWNLDGRTFFDVLLDLVGATIHAMVAAPDIDFDDQIYLPIYHQWRVKPFDFVFVDECQDLSPANRKLLHLISDERTRFCFVGDRRQAIYGFRGADNRSIQRIQEEFGTSTLPLSICYRCPKDVVRMAQGLSPEIEWHDENDDGKVSVEAERFHPNLFEANDLIVCRLNAPIIKAALQLARARKRCVVLGRDFGRSLANLVKSFKCGDISEVPGAAGRWKTKKVKTLLDMGRDMDSTSVVSIVDKHEALMHFLTEMNPISIAEYLGMIETLFSDDEDGRSIVLSTVHKAKGKEFDRVFVLDAGYIGRFKKSRGDDQESNIMYVAVTRAKRELGFVDLSGTRASDLYRDMLRDYDRLKNPAPVAAAVGA